MRGTRSNDQGNATLYLSSSPNDTSLVRHLQGKKSRSNTRSCNHNIAHELYSSNEYHLIEARINFT